MNKKEIFLDIEKFKSDKVHLGCGNMYKEGYINIDFPDSSSIYERKRSPDITEDITKIFFKENSLNEIFMHHLLEHFQRHEAIKLLLRFNKWLKPEGILNLAVPDVEECVSEYISASYRRKKELIRHCFGSHEGVWATHHEGWIPETLKEILIACGFKALTVNRMKGQWPAFTIVSKKVDSPKIELIKNFIHDFSPDVEGYKNFLLEYWMKELGEEIDAL